MDTVVETLTKLQSVRECKIEELTGLQTKIAKVKKEIDSTDVEINKLKFKLGLKKNTAKDRLLEFIRANPAMCFKTLLEGFCKAYPETNTDNVRSYLGKLKRDEFIYRDNEYYYASDKTTEPLEYSSLRETVKSVFEENRVYTYNEIFEETKLKLPLVNYSSIGSIIYRLAQQGFINKSTEHKKKVYSLNTPFGFD